MNHLHVVLVPEACLSCTDMNESIAVLMPELELKQMAWNDELTLLVKSSFQTSHGNIIVHFDSMVSV